MVRPMSCRKFEICSVWDAYIKNGSIWVTDDFKKLRFRHSIVDILKPLFRNWFSQTIGVPSNTLVFKTEKFNLHEVAHFSERANLRQESNPNLWRPSSSSPPTGTITFKFSAVVCYNQNYRMRGRVLHPDL